MGCVIRGWESLVQEPEKQPPQPHHLVVFAWISSLDWQAQAPPINDKWENELVTWLTNSLSKLMAE